MTLLRGLAIFVLLLTLFVLVLRKPGAGEALPVGQSVRVYQLKNFPVPSR
jgi:hypothetical protein